MMEQRKTQINLGRQQITNPDLIYVFVSIANNGKDRFFVLTKLQLQEVCIKYYSDWMGSHEWKRPRSPESYDCRFSIPEVQEYENNWKLISARLASSAPDQSLESSDE